MKVSELMTRDVIAVDEGATIGEAVSVLVEHGFRHLPIVRGRRPVGMISDRDLRRVEGMVASSLLASGGSGARGDAAYGAPVTSLAQGDVVAVPESASVREAIDAMLEGHVSSVVVVDERGELAGIVSTVDVLRTARAFL
jgi:acetoin utilization protein AcuB